ncbi:ubiquitinyl hydrolase 1 [Malassezia vespertilionis]|uniref:Ubiquitin carboxyl-terminal hydrolase n=1 Tax=Malassezia vespertilionis TaxID=2020962 RepID=A0A2N1JED6_9BASI|nr:ubiquitinyl hydrolase 1 [Malassezia vespertilionis]PKI84909.1 hypothetical protein MVES_000812 [Malassezia vespertilionis]WFD05534.1 ubiquitinyl hydrolase 1 [Malassezia vespertilionis]
MVVVQNAWGKPKAWAPPARAPAPSATPVAEKRTTWAAPPAKQVFSLEQLYADAHKQFHPIVTTPVGLVNQGNSCFASVILQMLVYTRPLYHFLTSLHREVPQDLSNSTPLLEAIFRFLRGIPEAPADLSLASAQELDTAPILPDYIFDAMRLHKRFDLLHLGHQEDAEEFFSMVLSTLHDELLLVYQRAMQRQTGRATVQSPALAASGVDALCETREAQRPQSPDGDTWLEVGQKGKTSLTRTSGTLDAESPITRMFDGKLRSILTIPGSKTSVVLEPCRTLPLDIQPPHVHAISDALRNTAVPEEISGVWSPGRNAFVEATKHVLLEQLPPVLVLHLKRFVYDEVGGVQKSCKNIAYPLTLDMAPEMMSALLRTTETNLQYTLFGVVYHHGRLATGGHYTVAVMRQDGSGWIHIDDTYVSPIPTEEVLHPQKSAQLGSGQAYLLFYHRL